MFRGGAWGGCTKERVWLRLQGGGRVAQERMEGATSTNSEMRESLASAETQGVCGWDKLLGEGLCGRGEAWGGPGEPGPDV